MAKEASKSKADNNRETTSELDSITKVMKSSKGKKVRSHSLIRVYVPIHRTEQETEE